MQRADSGRGRYISWLDWGTNQKHFGQQMKTEKDEKTMQQKKSDQMYLFKYLLVLLVVHS